MRSDWTLVTVASSGENRDGTISPSLMTIWLQMMSRRGCNCWPCNHIATVCSSVKKKTQKSIKYENPLNFELFQLKPDNLTWSYKNQSKVTTKWSRQWSPLNVIFFPGLPDPPPKIDKVIYRWPLKHEELVRVYKILKLSPTSIGAKMWL